LLEFLDTTGINKAVADATGKVWQTGDIYETAAIVSIYTMIFVSVLGLLKIANREGRPSPSSKDFPSRIYQPDATLERRPQ
jgi:hypothetical protein